MTSLAIPSMPPPAVAKVDGATPPADTGNRFGDALRESQAQPKATGDGHSADPDAGSSPHKNADAGVDKPDDKKDTKNATVLPGMVPAVPAPPVPVRQSVAATGRPVPTSTPAGVQPAILQNNPLSPAVPATPPGVANNPGADTALVETPIAAPAPAAHTPLLGVPVANASLASASGTKAPTTAAPGVSASTTQPAGTESLPSSTPDAEVAAAPGASDVDAVPPASDQRGDATTPSNSAPNAFAAQLAQLAGMHPGTAPTQPPPAPVQLAMQSAPGQPQFAQEVGQHVSWLAGQNVQQAEIQLNPRKLGPIQVEITTHQDRVDVTFAVQHPQTVHALQQTLPQLHHMLAQQGLNLGNASVGQQAPGRQHPAFAQHPGATGAGRETAGEQPDPPPTWRTLRVAVPGRVDDFA
ncbi:MAG TPA: flagellar hook-length control protein FliK [Rhodanobacteraceae bacterium]|nr:flagellar hook-length control protein FliK [Rhodanobacteraceae bacterium]